MKNCIAVVSFLLLVLLVSCNQNDTMGGNPISPQPMNLASDSGQKENSTSPATPLKNNHYFFKLAIPAGASYEYVINTSNHSIVKAPDKSVETKTNVMMNVVYSMSGDSAGNSIFNISYKRLDISISTTDEPDEKYSSDNVDSYEKIDKLLSKLKTFRFKVTLDEKGKLVSVTGLKEIEANILTDMRGESPAMQEIVKKFISQIAGADFIENNFGKNGNLSVPGGLEKGKEWQGTEQFKSLMDFETSTRNKVTTVNKKEVVIETTGNIKTGDNKPIQAMGHNFTAKLEGQQEGTTRIDPVTGLLISVESITEVKGTLYTIGVEVPVKIVIKKDIKGKRI